MVRHIHVCENWDEDILIWLLTPDSVRSGYHMLVASCYLRYPSAQFIYYG